MSKTFKAPEGCPCGCLLPWHLFELGFDKCVHRCSCGREFGLVAGEITLISGEVAGCPDE